MHTALRLVLYAALASGAHGTAEARKVDVRAPRIQQSELTTDADHWMGQNSHFRRCSRFSEAIAHRTRRSRGYSDRTALLVARGSKPSKGLVMPSNVLSIMNGLLMAVIIVVPLLTSDGMRAACRSLKLHHLLEAALVAIAHSCEQLRTRAPLLFVSLHAGATYACGDIIAQIRGGHDEKHKSMDQSKLIWQPLRSLRSLVVGIFADALPFYGWSILLSRVVSGALPGPFRGSEPALVVLKILLHIVFFQTFTNTLYMASQALLRGDGIAGAVLLLRRQLWRTCLLTSLTFPVAGVVVYSLPSIALQSALRNAGVLVFAVYLAIISNAAETKREEGLPPNDDALLPPAVPAP